MGSRLRTNVKHLIECFCEVVSPVNSDKGPWVLQKFPESFKEEEMLKQIALFAFPCEIQCATVQHFSFVLTSLDSKWTFGFCRQAPNAQTALVLLSYLPWHELFYKILNEIAELMQEQAIADLNSFLEALYQRDVPDPGTTLHIPYGKAHRVYTCKCPNTYTLPSIPENRNLTEYFNAVDTHNMMVIFASMLHERRIVMISSRISRLSACIQAANAVIYPMFWQHIFIPVLPPHLMDYLLAPMPYLAGVPSPTWQRVRKSELGEMVVLDVDTNRIESPFNDLESLPPDIVNSMRRRLKTPGHMMGDGVARVFLRALVQLIGGYRDALRFRQGEHITFCRDAFLQSRPVALRPFLESMLHLQIFQQFIEERLDMLNTGQGFSDEFELEACLYSDKSSNRLKQQYKEWLTTMRKESGALFKTVKNKANPAMRNAVKTMKEQSRLAKEKSRIAYKDIRSRFRDMQVSKEEMDETRFSSHVNNGQTFDKPRSAPSSPKFNNLSVSNTKYLSVSPQRLTRNSSPISEKTHSLRRCETSVSQHYNTGSTSPAFPVFQGRSSSSSSDESSNEDDLHLAPLNLNLVEDMKDILFKPPATTTPLSPVPPAVDRSLKPSLISPPVSPTNDVYPLFVANPTSLIASSSQQPLPLPPPRCRKRSEAASVIPLSQKNGTETDLIRLDSTSSSTTIDEFDPLRSQKTSPDTVACQQGNPLYPLSIPQQSMGQRTSSGESHPSFKGYTSRFATGNDLFTSLLEFTRTNLGPSSETGQSNGTQPKDTLSNKPKSTWTTFE